MRADPSREPNLHGSFPQKGSNLAEERRQDGDDKYKHFHLNSERSDTTTHSDDHDVDKHSKE